MRSFFEKRSYILIVASIVFIFFAAVLIANLVGTALETRAKFFELDDELHSQEAENDELRKQLENGISEEEEDYIARNDLGYILPGERVYEDAS